MRSHFTAALLALGWIFAAINTPAATISWSGAGGDELWSNPTNWTGGVLPTSDDDVVINVPGNTTVRMDAYNVWVRSLQCAESFILELGPFRVTAGSSTISGAFVASYANYYYGLGAYGPGTVLTLSGAVTNVGSLSAADGAVIAVPGARQLTVGSYPYYASLSATGPGSALVMTNLTNVVISLYSYLEVSAADGALVDLRRLQNPDGPLRVSAAAPDSIVNLSAMSGLWKLGEEHPPNSWRPALSATDGGTILIPNITAFENVDVTVSGMTNIALAQVRSFTLGTLHMINRTNGLNALTNFIGSLNATDSRLNGLVAVPNFNGSVSANNSRLDLTNITSLHATNMSVSISADQSSIINLSRVTNVTGGWPFQFSALAQGGSHIDFRGLRLPSAPILATSDGEGSVINLAGLVGDMDGGGLTARNGGSLLVSNVTAMRNVSLDIRDTAVLPTVQLRSVSNSYITLVSRTNGFEGLTNFTGSITATDARLDLTNFTVLIATNDFLDFTAYQGSFIDLSRVTSVVGGYGIRATAIGGSHIDLSGLVSEDSPVYANADGAESLIDLSGLNGLWRSGPSGGLSASAGATISIPNITAMEGVTLSVSGDASVDLSQIGSVTDCSITLTSRTNDFSGLTNLVGTWIGVSDSHLTLTNITTLYTTNGSRHISANYGSVIDLSRVTNWVSSGWQLTVYAYNGSRVDLHRLPTPDGPIAVDARYADSVVDLSGFTGLWSNGSLTAWEGASVLISNVTAMEGTALELQGSGNVPLAQIQSFASDSIALYYQTNIFPSLTNFTGDLRCLYSLAGFPSLTQLNATNYWISFAANGSLIDLSQVTNVVAETYGLSLYAYDSGRIEIPNLETIVAGSVSAVADGTDAVIDLSSLTGFFSDNDSGSLASRNGGAILLNSDAMLLAGVAIDFQSNPGGPLPSFLAPSQSLVLYGQPWLSYRVEARDPSVAGSAWSLYKRVPLTEPFEIVGSRPPKDIALRVRAFVADPPEVDIRLATPGAVEPILFGVPGRTYRLETTTSLSGSIVWQNGPPVTLTNSFFIFLEAVATNEARFYRSRKL